MNRLPYGGDADARRQLFYQKDGFNVSAWSSNSYSFPEDGLLRAARHTPDGLRARVVANASMPEIRSQRGDASRRLPYLEQHAQFLEQLRQQRTWYEVDRAVKALRMAWGVHDMTWRERQTELRALPYREFLLYLNSPLMDALDALFPATMGEFEDRYSPLYHLRVLGPVAAATGARMVFAFRDPLPSDVTAVLVSQEFTPQAKAMSAVILERAGRLKHVMIAEFAEHVARDVRANGLAMLNWFAQEHPNELQSPGWNGLFRVRMVWANVALVNRIYELQLQRHSKQEQRANDIIHCLFCVSAETASAMLQNAHVREELPRDLFQLINYWQAAKFRDNRNEANLTLVYRTLRQLYPQGDLPGSERHEFLGVV